MVSVSADLSLFLMTKITHQKTTQSV